jgi:hypothetical protein
MTTWSLSKVLGRLHDDIERRLATAREVFGHPGTKGDASEQIWLELLQSYLPQRYCAEKAHVVDSKGVFSQQIDIVVFDRQYSPFVFKYEGQVIIPAESVYAIFEAKQVINATHVEYAHEKVASVRRLHRTSLPIPHAGGLYEPRSLPKLIGGILTLESEWSPGLGDPLIAALKTEKDESHLDLGCVAAHGLFSCDEAGHHTISTLAKPATAFLLELIARLQSLGTVPMIDTRAYAQWLEETDK